MDHDSKPQPLRILYVSSVDPTSASGPGINEREFLAALVAEPDVDVRAVAPCAEAPHAEIRPALGARVRPPRSSGIAAFLVHQVSLFVSASREVRRMRPDVLVYRASILPWPQLLLAVHRVPHVMKTLGAGVIDGVEGRAKGVYRLLDLANRAMLRRLVAGAEYVDVCTPQLARFLADRLRLPESTFDVVANATNVRRFQVHDDQELRRELQLDGARPIVGFVGGRPYQRGGGALVEALPELVRDHPAINAVIVGGGSDVEALRRRAAELGVADRVVTPGHVPYDLVPSYISIFDVGVALDDEDRSSRIGSSSQKIRQYVSAGKPVVALGEGNDFLDDLSLGTRIARQDELVGALRGWLRLTDAERSEHARRAVGFAQAELSIDSTLAHRLRAWRRAIGDRG